jgi:hypothetical protein
MKYFILEWNGLNDEIGLYEYETKTEDIALVYEEIDLSNYSNALVLDLSKLKSFLKAVEVFRAKIEADELINLS